MHNARLTRSWPMPLIPILVLLLAACDEDTATGPDEDRTVTRDFTTGQQWTAGFADFPVGQEDFFELVADYRALPAPLDTGQSAHFLSGSNRSDDLFMFLKGSESGFAPGRTYRVAFEVEIATNVPHDCVGIGGPPGESVFVKAGASAEEPRAIVVGGDYQMNVDKGNQSTGGENAVVLGNVANSIPCGEEPQWERKTLSSQETIDVTAGPDGVLWFFVGTDSGFEGTTSLFFLRFTAMLEPV